jgi:hypothetical protein
VKVLILDDNEAQTIYNALFVGSDALDQLAEKVRMQLDDPLLGAAGERTILIRQGTPPLMMANFDDPADAELTWLAMASHDDRLALAPVDDAVIVDGTIDWPD